MSARTPEEARSLILYAIAMTALAGILLWCAYIVRHVLLLIYVSGIFAIGFSPIVRVIERQKVIPIGKRVPRWLAILILYVVRELGLTPTTLGIAFSIGNIGVLVGALLSERVGKWIGMGPTIVWSALFSSFSLVAVAVAPREAPLPFLIAGGFIGTVTAVIYNVNQVSLRQAITPDRMLGRMNATMRFIVWGTIPIGALAGAVLAETIGLQATIWIGAGGSFLGFLPVLLSPVRSLREIPSSEPA